MSNSRNASVSSSDSPASITSLHSGSDEKPYNNYDSHKCSRIDAIRECSLPIPIPKPNLPPLEKLKNRRLQINPAYFKAVPVPTCWIYDTASGVTGGLPFFETRAFLQPPEPDPKEYKYYLTNNPNLAPDLKSKQ